jgi:hypothetical protein
MNPHIISQLNLACGYASATSIDANPLFPISSVTGILLYLYMIPLALPKVFLAYVIGIFVLGSILVV